MLKSKLIEMLNELKGDPFIWVPDEDGTLRSNAGYVCDPQRDSVTLTGGDFADTLEELPREAQPS